MIISARGKYALGLMVDLAIHDEEEPVKLKDVARRQGIPLKYLEQVSNMLKKAGLIRSYRGFYGGYKIKYHTDEYTVGMILRVTEGTVTERYTFGNIAAENASESEYLSGLVTEHIVGAVNEVTSRISLHDLIDWQKARENLYVI